MAIVGQHPNDKPKDGAIAIMIHDSVHKPDSDTQMPGGMITESAAEDKAEESACTCPKCGAALKIVSA